MEIKHKNFKILVGEDQYELYKIVKRNRIGTGTISSPNGEEYYKDELLGYYTDIGNVIKKMIKSTQANSNKQVKLEEFLEDYTNLLLEYEKLIKKFVK